MKKVFLLMIFFLDSCLVSDYQVHAICCLCGKQGEVWQPVDCNWSIENAEDCKTYCEQQGYKYLMFSLTADCHRNSDSDEWECKYPNLPTLKEWVLIILALSVGGFFVWQLKRRKAVVRVQ